MFIHAIHALIFKIDDLFDLLTGSRLPNRFFGRYKSNPADQGGGGAN